MNPTSWQVIAKTCVLCSLAVFEHMKTAFSMPLTLSCHRHRIHHQLRVLKREGSQARTMHCSMRNTLLWICCYKFHMSHRQMNENSTCQVSSNAISTKFVALYIRDHELIYLSFYSGCLMHAHLHGISS